MFRLFRKQENVSAVETPWGEAATEADVMACFRLLLGRPPNPEEWRGHAGHAGEPLDNVVSLYLTSHEFAQRGLLRPTANPQIKLADCDGFQLFVDASDIAVGRQVVHGSYEPDVTAVVRRMLRPGMAVIDIGANIGYFSMLAASLVGPEGRVLAVEPNARNARMLEASRRENGFGQVDLCQAAAGRALGLLVLNTTHSNGTTSVAADDVAQLLAAETVASLPLDCLVPPGQRVDFIKIDVEGAEYNALLGGRRIIEADRPMIVTEFSPAMMEGISQISGPDYLRWLLGWGYALAVIQPDGSTVPAATVEAVMELYRSRAADHIDLLASPSSQ